MRHRIADIRNELRSRIATGKWQPGARIPTRAELAGELGVPGTTVQEALAELVADGSLMTAKRGGTRVAANPPECRRLALVLGGNARSSLFGGALANAARMVETHHAPWRMDVVDQADAVWMRHLVTGAVAGALWLGAAPPPQTPAWVAHAQFADHPWHQVPEGMRAIDLDNRSFLATAIDLLVAHGCRRPAVLTTTGFLDVTMRHQRDGYSKLGGFFRSRGLELAPWRLAMTPTGDDRIVEQAVRLLYAQPAATRADGFIITDDHLRRPLATALKRAAWKPRTVVALGNCRPTRATDGFHTVGFAAECMIDAAVSLLTLPDSPSRLTVTATRLELE
jgi:hypothetical protein